MGTISKNLSFLLLFGLISSITGCISVPPEISQAHQKELEIIQSLKNSHLAMVDSFVDSKLAHFENYYFDAYGPAYLANWKKAFPQVHNREYDEIKDFSILYADLVAEYQESIIPIEKIRGDLKKSINDEYSNTIESHKAIDRWLKSVHSLQNQNKAIINNILNTIKPGLSLDVVDNEVNKAITILDKKIIDFIK